SPARSVSARPPALSSHGWPTRVVVSVSTGLYRDSFAAGETDAQGFAAFVLRAQQLIPSKFSPAIGRFASQHRCQRRFHSRRSLVVELAARDACDEPFLLLRIGLREVIRKVAGCGKRHALP